MVILTVLGIGGFWGVGHIISVSLQHDEETWRSDAGSPETNTRGDTQAHLTSSEDDEIDFLGLPRAEPTIIKREALPPWKKSGPCTCDVFMAKHMKEVEADVASYAATHSTPSAKQGLPINLGRARPVGSRVTRSNLPSVAEEVLDAILAKVPIDQPDVIEFDHFCRFPATLPDMDDWDERGPAGCNPSV
eukprot:6482173-Amphidinium_carterae.1